MKKENELSKLKVKRRGPLSAFRDAAGRPMKVRITITLDQDLVEHFKAEAAKPGALPYQTQINQTLRKVLTWRRAAAGADGGHQGGAAQRSGLLA